MMRLSSRTTFQDIGKKMQYARPIKLFGLTSERKNAKISVKRTTEYFSPPSLFSRKSNSKAKGEAIASPSKI